MLTFLRYLKKKKMPSKRKWEQAGASRAAIQGSDQPIQQDSVQIWLVLNCIQVSRRPRRQSRGDYKCLGHASNEREPRGRPGEHPHASRPGLDAVQYSKNMHVVKVDRIWCILIGSW